MVHTAISAPVVVIVIIASMVSSISAPNSPSPSTWPSPVGTFVATATLRYIRIILIIFELRLGEDPFPKQPLF